MGIIEASSAYHNPAKLQAIATRKNEIAIDGPAGGRPCMSAPAVLLVRRKFMITSSACACNREGAWKYSPAAAVPVRMKIPEPMMAPMPSAVSDHGPSDLLSRCSGWSASEISLSMDLQQKTCLSEVRMTAAGSVGCDKRLRSPGCSFQLSAVSFQQKPKYVGTAALGCPRAQLGCFFLPLRLAAGQLLDLGLLRSACVVAGLERLLGLALLA